MWDACSLTEKLIGRAEAELILIDNWAGTGTLDMLAKKCFAFTRLDASNIAGLIKHIV